MIHTIWYIWYAAFNMKIDVSYFSLNSSYDTCTVHDAICDTMIKRHLHFLLVFIIKKSHLFIEELVF